MVASQPRLDVGRLKDERVAEEFTNRPSGDFGGLDALGNPEQLLNASKAAILDVASRSWNSRSGEEKCLSQRTLDTIDQSHRAKLNGRAVLFREWRHKTAPCAEGGQVGLCVRRGRVSPVVK